MSSDRMQLQNMCKKGDGSFKEHAQKVEGSGGPGGTPNDGKGDDDRDGRHHYRYSTMKRWWATHPQSFADLVFASERIDVGPKRGKFDHPTRTTEKTGANEEGENEGETHAVTAIPIRPSFPPIQQCHYSANNKPSPYPPPSYPQRPSLKSTTKPTYRTSNDKHHL